jgi:lipopolysaccharide export system permease protein
MKASGVNMFRIILPLLIAGGLITWGMVEFNDRILPDLNKQARMLRADISAMRPTLVFQSGIFISDVPGYLILIDKVDHRTSDVEGVRITDTRIAEQPRIIVAEHGHLEMTNHGSNMRFTLYNGEVHSLDTKDPANYRRVNFQKQVINIAGESSEFRRSNSDYRTDREMSIGEMKGRVSKATTAIAPLKEKIGTEWYAKLDYLFADSAIFPLGDTIADTAARDYVVTEAHQLMNQVNRFTRQIAAQYRMADKYKIEIYKKYSIPAASLAFILIGAPLGVVARRRGMGMAISVSIGIFIVYWAFLIGGEDLADRGLLSPFWAMWSANILIALLGVYLIYKVVTEKPMFAFFRDMSPRRNADKKN